MRKPGIVSARRNAISGQFAARLIEMMESPAFRVLSHSAHRALCRIEIEYAHHGGADNGRLPVTFQDFINYGIERKSISPALRELEALGFIEIMERGRAGNADHRRPSRFRLTFRPSKGIDRDGSHDWRMISTDDEAKEIARQARNTIDARAQLLGGRSAKVRKNRNQFRKTPIFGSEKPTENENSRFRFPELQAKVGVPELLSISRGGRLNAPGRCVAHSRTRSPAEFECVAVTALAHAGGPSPLAYAGGDQCPD